MGDLFGIYIFNLYLEQITVDEDHVETRLRYYRTLISPLISCSLFTIHSKFTCGFFFFAKLTQSECDVVVFFFKEQILRSECSASTSEMFLWMLSW